MNIATYAASALAVFSLCGCIVAPIHPGYGAPAGVAYVGPTYVAPGPGYGWAYHSRFGWGWRHPQRGWHRNWR